MDSVNRTLYIPLYGKAWVSGKGIILSDPKAETIWAENGFPLKGKSRSKWLAYYMAMRASVFDRWVTDCARENGDAAVVHIGCGLDARVDRTDLKNQWYDIDFPEVIEQRRTFFPETDRYKMLGADVRREGWLDHLPRQETAIVVMEGVSMYLTPVELAELMQALRGRYPRVHLLMDCYTEFAARASKYKNPINDVGVTQVYGLDDPGALEAHTGFSFVREHEMTPDHLIGQLKSVERKIFRSLYGGAIARRMYRLYEFESQ